MSRTGILEPNIDTNAQHPIINLPTDVCLEIFLHCIPPNAVQPLVLETPLTLLDITHVCSSWRSLALSSPALWAISTIRLGKGRTGLIPRLELLELFLERAGEHVLDICLDGWIKAPSPPVYQELNIPEIMKNILPRVRRLELNTTDFFTHHNLKKLSSQGAPLLEELVLMGPTLGHAHRPDKLCSRLWASSPKLRRITISRRLDCQFSWLSDGLHIPFGQLTHLNIESPISAVDALEILEACQDLTNFSIHDLMTWKPLPKLRQCEVTVQSLQRLSIQAGNECLPPSLTDSTRDLLHLIDAPSLYHLSLRRIVLSSPRSYSGTFLHDNPSRNLKTLRIDDVEIVPEDIIELLEQSGSHLTTLELIPSSTSTWHHPSVALNETIKRLGVWDEDRQEFPFCPRLVNLSINVKTILHPTSFHPVPHSTPFADMVEIRWRKDLLKHVTILGCTQKHQGSPEVDALLSLKKGGMYGIELE